MCVYYRARSENVRVRNIVQQPLRNYYLYGLALI